VENYGDYYDGQSWNAEYGTSDFSKTDYYSDWEDDNDSSSDWSSSDWDSLDTDWDSDW